VYHGGAFQGHRYVAPASHGGYVRGNAGAFHGNGGGRGGGAAAESHARGGGGEHHR